MNDLINSINRNIETSVNTIINGHPTRRQMGYEEVGKYQGTTKGSVIADNPIELQDTQAG